jgi:hypothetical protein
MTEEEKELSTCVLEKLQEADATYVRIVALDEEERERLDSNKKFGL